VRCGADAIHAARAGVVDFRDEIAFAHADFDRVEDALVHRFDDARGVSHVADFRLALDRALPIDEGRGVNEAGIRQMFLQRSEGRSRKPVVIHLDTDRQPVETTLGKFGR
jgi:hypothetical protein